MKYQTGVSVIVEDDIIKVLGEDGSENTIIFFKPNSDNKTKVIDKRSSSVNNSIIFEKESYIERLYEESLKEVDDLDRMILKEAFVKEYYESIINSPSIITILKRKFKALKRK